MNNKKKKLAIYHPWIYLKGGAERLILDIVTKSDYDWTVFTHHFDRENTFPGYKDLDLVELPRVSVNRNYSRVRNAALKIMTTKADLKDYDLLVVMSEGVGDYFVFRNNDLPSVCLCLTPLKIIHDRYSRQRYLEDNRGVFLKYAVSSMIFNIFDRMAWKHYKKVICISNEVKNRVLNARLAPEEKIEVLYPGVDFGEIESIPKYYKYFFIPGRIMWQKNIELGIEAFKKFQETAENKNFKLIIAGMVDSKSVSYYQKLKKLCSDNKNIEFVENPHDGHLFDLYKKCYCMLFTSLNEDWGIVPLEAMAFGKPVISVNRGGPKESIIDGRTGFLVEPEPEKMLEKMLLLAGDIGLTEKMGKAGQKHVRKFNTSGFHEGFNNIINSLIDKS